MKKIIIALVALALPVMAIASGGAHLDKADIDLSNKGSLQNGAKMYVNYCLGCHSLKYMSYARMGKDLGLPDELVQENLMFTGKKIGEYMTISMPAANAEKWFGVTPPDLSVIARSRGADWIYTYLRNFYVDDSRPFGVNNRVFESVGMPHVLSQLEGLKKPVYTTEKDEYGTDRQVLTGYEYITEGSMTPAEYDRQVRDLVNFLVYTGEPAKLVRYDLGIKVILFLLFFLIIAYLLKKEYWKDIH
ncbi:MAG TPA: cytochrome c1 [Gammaproteobacteria bacterium]|nr:cytochrome c1 [Gammaproteobacteria bacterium]